MAEFFVKFGPSLAWSMLNKVTIATVFLFSFFPNRCVLKAFTSKYIHNTMLLYVYTWLNARLPPVCFTSHTHNEVQLLLAH